MQTVFFQSNLKTAKMANYLWGFGSRKSWQKLAKARQTFEKSQKFWRHDIKSRPKDHYL